MNLFTTLQHLVPQQTLSEMAGRVASSRHHYVKKALITGFAKAYDIKLDDYQRQNLEAYESFNDFFTRELNENARQIDETKDGVICPADGTVSQIGQITDEKILQAKGRNYDVGQLLADYNDGAYFANGSFATIYLAPSNYHRVHMPFDAKLVETRYIPGMLFSVNNTTAENVPDLFARNERLVCVFELALPDGEVCKACVVLVGAMIVAGIECVATGKIERTDYIQRLQHDINLQKGDELGRFYLGSTAIIVLPQQASTDWLDDIGHNSKIKMGQLLGVNEVV